MIPYKHSINKCIYCTTSRLRYIWCGFHFFSFDLPLFFGLIYYYFLGKSIISSSASPLFYLFYSQRILFSTLYVFRATSFTSVYLTVSYIFPLFISAFSLHLHMPLHAISFHYSPSFRNLNIVYWCSIIVILYFFVEFRLRSKFNSFFIKSCTSSFKLWLSFVRISRNWIQQVNCTSCIYVFKPCLPSLILCFIIWFVFLPSKKVFSHRRKGCILQYKLRNRYNLIVVTVLVD